MIRYRNLRSSDSYDHHYGRPNNSNTILGYNSDSDDSYTEEELLVYAQKSQYFVESDLLELAATGAADAYYAIGERYGRSHKAIKWYLRAAEKEHIEAQVKMAEYYLGSNAHKNKTKSLEWYLRADKNGRKGIAYSIAQLYRKLPDIADYQAFAMRWYLEACEEGDMDAAFQIGTMYENGEGVNQDYPLAMEWYLKADTTLRAHVASHIANLYLKGLGVEKDHDEAEKWYKKAYLRGDHSAAATIAKFYDPQGFFWWSKAAKHGDIDAEDRLQLISHTPYYGENQRTKNLIKEEIEKTKTERMNELELRGYHVTPTVKDVNKMKSEYEKKIQALQDRINELENPTIG
ncbi:HCP-like protein [Backusella circina FSU 941]|nr:HCP-like protein [Backusella circina FSU 941]